MMNDIRPKLLNEVDLKGFNSILDIEFDRANKLMIHALEQMLIIEVSKIEPDCNEDTILKFAPNILKMCSEGSNVDHYYYMKSANEKVFLFKTYWVMEHGKNMEVTAHFNITK